MSPQEFRALQARGRAQCRALYPITPDTWCVDCLDQYAVTRHHRDGDATHNAPENVAILCHACHVRLHTRERWHADRDPARKLRRSRIMRHYTAHARKEPSMRAVYTVVQVRNVPREWDGWLVFSGRRRIASFFYKREAMRFVRQQMWNANAR